MYVQKKLMAKLEQEKAADLANNIQQQQQFQQQQIEALKTFASIQQINSVQQQQQFNTALQKEQLTALLTAMMNNSNFILNQQQQLNTPIIKNDDKLNQSKSQISRKRSHSDLDACSSSEEEPYCYAKLRQPPSLGKINLFPKNNSDNKVDQNNNSSQEQTPVLTTNSDTNKHYDSNHSDEEEIDGKKQNKSGRNYRKMMIEKRRRDRINSSLDELRRLVPAAFEKQGSAKLEKAEILQMTVDHLKSLHAKGFNSFSLKSTNLDEFALDYHSIGFRECATEVERYLQTQTNIDHMVKERVISHLKKLNTKSLASRDQIKDSNNNKLSSNNSNLNNKNSNTINKKKSNNKSNKQDNSSTKLNNHISNLHNLHNNISLFTPLSPPSSSVSPLSTSSSSSIITTSSNSLESDLFNQQQQMYIPYALLKSKKLPFNHPTTIEQINNLNNSINLINKTYKPNENQLPSNLITPTLKCL